jgi:hypothetical protein
MTTEIESKKENEILAALGGLILEFGVIEYELMLAITSLAQIEFGTLLSIVAGDSFSNLLKVFDSVFSNGEHTPDESDAFQALLKRIRAANEKRNYFIHALWDVGDGSVGRMLKYAKGRKGLPITWEAVDVKVSEIRALCDELNSLSEEIERFATTEFLKNEVEHLPPNQALPAIPIYREPVR